jgi:MFS family permease
VLLALAVVDSAGYSVITPVLPELARRSGEGPAVMGALAGTFPVAMLGGFVLAGGLVHRGRLRTALLLSILVTAASSVLFAGPAHLGVWFVARAGMGLGSGGLWIGITLATLAYWPGREYVSMSRIYAGYSVGAVVGPALGSLGGYRAPFLAYAVLLLLFGPAALLLPSPGRHRFVRDRSAIRTRRFWVATLAIALAMTSIGLLDGVLPLHFGTRLSQSQIGVTYVAVAVLYTIGSVLAARFSAWRATLLGSVAVTVGITAAGGSDAVAAWFTALVVVALGTAFAETGSTGLLLEASPTDRIVTPMVLWSQLAMFGYLIGPAVGGVAAEHFGFAALGLLPLVLLVATVSLRRGTPGSRFAGGRGRR